MIWALADLHLSHARPKPMDIFGARWRDHSARIARAWRERVADDDLVLIAGDVSWAMKPDDALEDLRWIDALPGRKGMSRGNHDSWWSAERSRRSLTEGARHGAREQRASAQGGRRLGSAHFGIA